MRVTIWILAAFLLLASASVAAAECEWLLWVRTADSDWLLKSAVDTRKECEERRLEIARRLLPENEPETVFDLWESEVGLVYRCLPDTIDPLKTKTTR